MLKHSFLPHPNSMDFPQIWEEEEEKKTVGDGKEDCSKPEHVY